MQKNVNKLEGELVKLLEEVVTSLEKVRCYSLREILTDYIEGRVVADEALKELQKFNIDFEKIDVATFEGSEVPRNYVNYVKIGDTEINVGSIKRLTKGKYYKYTNNKMMYTIIVNEATNDYNPFNNIVISWDSEQERDRQYLLLKDKLCSMSDIRFN